MRRGFILRYLARTAGGIFPALLAAVCLLVLSPAAHGYQITNNIEIRVREDGFYSVSSSELSDILNISVGDVETMLSRVSDIPLYSRGEKVATLISPSYDEVFFYGEAIDDVYTDENVYLLKQGRGDVIGTVLGAGPVPAEGGSFRGTAHYEKDEEPLTGYFDDPDSDYWAWAKINAGDTNNETKSFSFDVSGVVSNTDLARLNLQLFCGYSSGVTNEHHVIVDLNSTQVGEKFWGGVGTNLMEMQFPQSRLVEGTNTLSVTGEESMDPESFSIFYVDSFDLEYTREYKAVDEQLMLTGYTNDVVTVAGFISSNIWVADISDPKIPKLLDGTTLDFTNGSYRVSFEPSASNVPYCAFAHDSAKMVCGLASVTNNTLRLSTNNAEYLVITVPDLAVPARALADYRSGLRLKTMVVYLGDIYHEFNDGIKDPQAIKDFLSYAYTNWTGSPKYVVLAGHGTYDYKDETETLVPPVLINTSAGMFASDNWYTDFDGDGIPEIAIGRLPALTGDELQHLVDRIISYEEVVSGDWLTNVVFCADDHDDGGDFHGSSDGMAGRLPGGYSAEKVYLTNGIAAETRTRLLNGINNGALFMNYFGHSGLDRLATEGLLSTNNISALTNLNKPTIITAMSCVIGRFAVPDYDCLGEHLILATNGGAVAVWSPSGVALNKSSELLGEDFYRTVLAEDANILGDAIRESMQDYFARATEKDVLYFYNLLGDPGLLIRGVKLPSDDPYVPDIPAFIAWKESNFSEAELLDVVVSGDYADADGDEMINLVEYALGKDPGIPNSKSVLNAAKPEEKIAEEYDAIVTFSRRKDMTGVECVVEYSEDLLKWSSAGVFIVNTRVTDDGNGITETVDYFVRAPDGDSRGYCRLVVQKVE